MKLCANYFARYCAILIFCIVLWEIEAKGGRGGFGRGSSSSSRGGSWGGSKSSSSGGWFSSSKSSSPSYSRPSPSYSYPSPSYSYPSPSYSRPSPSYSAPSAPSPSYGWNVNTNSRGTSVGSNSPSYGWNVGSNTNTGSSYGSSSNTGSKPSYGWNVGSNTNNAPVGPPPAYPGLQNRPVQNSYSPPAYSPSYNKPPAYSPSWSNSPSYSSNNAYRTNTYNTYSSGRGSYYNSPGSNYGYGQSFGTGGLGSNTYISNNYYGNRGSSGSGFLTNALFYGAGMHHGHSWGRSNNHYYGSDYHRRSEWNEDSDRRWRATTQAPYFANKVPGEDKVLPASAVIGAATAFGLVSLLPLNVPAKKPLMYCNDTELVQAKIQIENAYIYQCINNTIEITCPKISTGNVNSTDVMNTTIAEFIETNEQNSTISETTAAPPPVAVCENRKMLCADNENENESIYCKSGTLLSNDNIFCNSTTLVNGTNVNETIAILNCYKGELPNSQAAFIPTTTQAPVTTTEKSLSISAKMHIFFLRLIGKSDVLEKKETTTPVPDIPQLSISDSSWLPEALTIPPETTTQSTTTTERPYKWMQKVRVNYENGSTGFELRDVPKELLDAQESAVKLSHIIGEERKMSDYYTKVYLDEITTTTERPYKWMQKIPVKNENGTNGHKLVELSKEFVDLHESDIEFRKRQGLPVTNFPFYEKVYITEPMETTTQMSTVSVNATEQSKISTTTDMKLNENDELDYV